MLAEDLRMRLDFGKSVHVNRTKLEQLIHFVKGKGNFSKYKPYDWSDYNYWIPNEEGEEAVSQFFAVGNAVNFRYWDIVNNEFTYCAGQRDNLQASGSKYMWRCLKSTYDSDPSLFEAKTLSSLEIGHIKKIFEDDHGDSPMPHLEERLRNWHDLGFKLYEYWDGQFYNLVKESPSLYKFVQLSRQFRAFDDPLCKLTMVNTFFHKGRGIGFLGEGALPGIDYQLMKEVLRMGIIVPVEEVAEKIERGMLLEKGEARELRNACMRVFLEIMEKTKVSGEILDNTWWFNSKVCTDQAPVCQDPVHAEKCVFLNVCDKNIRYKIPLEQTRYY
jgi:hypothetical protein